MRNNAADKKKGLRFTLRIKIIVMFGIVIAIMLIPLILLMRYSNEYINRYDMVISNVRKIDYIKTTTDAQPQRILNYCITNENINDSGEGEKIATMVQYISDIKSAIGNDETFAQNLVQAEVVEKLLNSYLQNYREGIGLCNDGFSLAGDSKFYTMNDISGYISDNCSILLNQEMKRTEEIQNKIAKDYRGMQINVIVMLACVMVVAVVLVVLLQIGVAGPIRLLSQKIAVIADKDLTDTTIIVRSRDEVGDLADIFNIMSHNLREVLEKVSSVSNEIERSFQEVTQNVEDTATGSNHISKAVDYMLETIGKQNRESVEVMSNIDNISGISEKIYTNANNIQTSARNSIDRADAGNSKLNHYTMQLSVVNDVMQEITQMINGLNSSAQQMNNIVNTIADISDETNLLSLNASIEAARAGETGRGFAVVAGQIQNLADSSKKSVEEIGTIIASVQNRTKEATDSMQQGLLQLERGNEIAEETKQSFGEIKQSISAVDAQVEEIVDNVKHLSEVVSGTSQNMDIIDAAMQDTSVATKGIADTVNTETANLQELTATMAALSEITSDLKRTLEQFRL